MECITQKKLKNPRFYVEAQRKTAPEIDKEITSKTTPTTLRINE